MSDDWNTDLDAAPKGEDLLVAMWGYGSDRIMRSSILNLGILLFEPNDEGQSERDGEKGDWVWNIDGDGWTDTEEIAAWRLPPKLPEFSRPIKAIE